MSVFQLPNQAASGWAAIFSISAASVESVVCQAATCCAAGELGFTQNVAPARTFAVAGVPDDDPESDGCGGLVRLARASVGYTSSSPQAASNEATMARAA